MTTAIPRISSTHAMKTAVGYKLRLQSISSGIFFAVFFFFVIVVQAAVRIWSPSTFSPVTYDFAMPTFIFLLLTCSIGAGTDFKLFIQNGFTRRQIFAITLAFNTAVALALTLVMTGLSALLNSLNPDMFAYRFLGLSFYANGSWSLSAQTNYLLVGVLLFAFLFLASGAGMMIGVFLDKASTRARLVTGGVIILLPFVFGLIIDFLETLNRINLLWDLLATLFSLGRETPQQWPLFGVLIAGGALAYGVTYLMNRHREVKRVAA